MGKKEMHEGLWWGDMRERHHFGDLGIDGRIILKWISRNGLGA